MRFLSASLRNFRSIEALDLDFSEPGQPDVPLPMAVFVGPNGAGKTAVLEGLIRLGWLLALNAAQQGTRPLKNDVRHGATQAELQARLRISQQERELLRQRDGEIFSGTSDEELTPEVVTRIRDDENLGGSWDIKLLSPRAGRIVDTTQLVASHVTPPALLYLGATRNLARSPISAVAPVTSENASELATSSEGSAERYQWTKARLVGLKFAQLLAREQGDNSSVFDRLWPAIERMLHPIRFKAVTPGLDILFETRTGVVEFDDLSSGQRSIVFVLADLLSRGIDEAAVLIDEPELHLHPRWQAEILNALREALPSCQFIVATQSPIVAASVREAKYIFDLGRLQE